MTAIAPSRVRAPDLDTAVLLDAALHVFAARGFEGASTRAIAARAGCHQPQINYYFSSKELLWQAALDHLFGLLDDALAPAMAKVWSSQRRTTVGDADSVTDAVAVIRQLIEAFVRFSADHPELHRIMNLESTDDSPRLRWIVERHLTARRRLLLELWSRVRDAGAGAELTADEVWEVLIGVGALPFANAPMLVLLGASDLVADEAVRRRIELVDELLGLR